MARSNVIIIKCPGCNEKFQAERQEESSFVSCPECDQQVKIGGLSERRRHTSHSLPNIGSLPSKRPETKVSFQDLSKGDRTQRIQVGALAKEAVSRGYLTKKILAQTAARDEMVLPEDGVFDEAPASEIPVTPPPMTQPFPVGAEAKAGEPMTPVPIVEMTPPPELNLEASEAEAPVEPLQAELAFEKVQVSPMGTRRVLRDAPKAEVPEPKPKVELIQLNPEEKSAEPVVPKQEFDDRRISEGAEWRRHKPQVEDDPAWEDEKPIRQAKPVSRRWRMARGLTAAAATILALGFAGMMVKVMFAGRSDADEIKRPVAEARKTPLTITEAYPKAEATIRSFLQSTSNEEALQYVRSPGRVAIRMKKFYSRGEFEPFSNFKIGTYDMAREKDGFLHLPISLEEASEMKEISVDLRTLKIDWESWVGFCDTPFVEFRDRKLTTPTLLRVFLSDYDYYNFEFNDREKYRSVRLYDGSQKHSLWGYFRKDSPAYREAGHHLVGTGSDEVQSSQRHPVILKAKFPDKTTNPDHDQIEITDFVKMGWVLPEEDA